MEALDVLLLFIPLFFGMAILAAVASERVVYRSGVVGPVPSLLLVLPVLFYGLYTVGMRPLAAGNDTARYVMTYGNLDGFRSAFITGVTYFGNTELLWWPLQSVLKPMLSIRGWLIANFVLVFGSAFLYYRLEAKAYKLSAGIFALVFMTFFLVYSGNIMRQALAIPIGALGFGMFMRRRYLLAAVLALLSIGLHWSLIVILVLPLLKLPIFKKNFVYVLVPVSAAALSPFSVEIVGWVVNILGLPEISSKFDLYFAGGRQSHVAAIWMTANFWICSTVSLAFLFFCKPDQYESQSLHKYVLLFLTLILLGVENADFSERYLPFILFVLPLMIGALVDRIRLPAVAKNLVFFGFFLSLAMLVFTAASSQYTLGYSL